MGSIFLVSFVDHPRPSKSGLTVDQETTVVLELSASASHARHSWTIHNDSPVAIKLRTHFTSGRSGFSLWLGEDYWLVPGESYRMSLAWTTPGIGTCPFSRAAEVSTTDPDRPQIRFKVVGRTKPKP